MHERPTWPDLNRAVPPGGYAWWYLDALSDDGRHALVAIVFVGSVFSPYYARARARDPAGAAAERHVAINVALYTPGPGPATPPAPRPSGMWPSTSRSTPLAAVRVRAGR